MYFTYGAHRHVDNEVNLVNMQQFPVFSDRLKRRTSRYRMTISGELQYATQQTLTDKIGELISAYSVDGQEACLYQDNGTPTHHRLAVTGNLVSGPRIMYRDWPKGDAAEYATKRTFRIILEAEYLEPDSQIVAFQETLQFRGDGGPLWKMCVRARGAPFPVQLADKTPQQIIQAGTVVGLSGFPIALIPAPMFPVYEQRFARQVSVGSPKLYGSMYLDYPMSYSYSFVLPTPQNAIPNFI